MSMPILTLLTCCAAALGLLSVLAFAWIVRPRSVPQFDTDTGSADDVVFSTVSATGWVRPQA
jgi:hypothetical protein